jgi:hypothetical protein
MTVETASEDSTSTTYQFVAVLVFGVSRVVGHGEYVDAHTMCSHLVVYSTRPVGRITGIGVRCGSDARTSGAKVLLVKGGLIHLVSGKTAVLPDSKKV